MEKRVRDYIENLFRSFKKSDATKDVKEELITNLLERIKDLEEDGMNSDEAFSKAVGSLGTKKEISKIFNFKSISEYEFEFEYHINKYLASISTAIYLAIGFIFDYWHPGWFVFLIAIAGSSFKVDDKKSYLFPIIILIYVFCGLMWNYWHPGWIIFPIGFTLFATINKRPGAILLMTFAIYLLIGMFFELWFVGLIIFIVAGALIAGRDELVAGLWLGVIAVYLYLGFALNLWHPGWLIFGVALTISILLTDRSIVGASWVIALTSYLYLGFEQSIWHPTWVVFIVAAAISAYLEESPTQIEEIE